MRLVPASSPSSTLGRTTVAAPAVPSSRLRLTLTKRVLPYRRPHINEFASGVAEGNKPVHLGNQVAAANAT